MATPRKAWFRVADSVAFEPWSNDVAATFMRLGAYLNTRWARDGRSAADAARVTLSPAVLCQLTGCAQVTRARRVLGELAAHVTLTVEAQGANTLIVWPKFSEFQRYESEPRAARETDGAPALPPPLDAPAPAPADARRETTSSSQAPPARRARGGGKTPAPDALTPDEQVALAHWCRDTLKRADLVPRLAALVDACFTYHRAKGNRHASWYATAQTWVRNEAEGRFGAPRASPAAQGGTDDLQRAALAALGRHDEARARALGGQR